MRGLVVLAILGACSHGAIGSRLVANQAAGLGILHTVLTPLHPVVRVGDTLQLAAMTVTADERSISCAPVWWTANPDVVRILPDGRVIGLRMGSATITATCVSGTMGTTLDVGPRRSDQ